MKPRAMALLLLLLTCPFILASSTSAKDRDAFHQLLIGKVTDIRGALATFEADDGVERVFSLNYAEENGINDLKTGDHLVVKVSAANLIIDVDRITEDGRLEQPNGRRAVVGTVINHRNEGKVVAIRLPNGKTATYQLKDSAAGRMSEVEAGSTIELHLGKESDLVSHIVIGS